MPPKSKTKKICFVLTSPLVLNAFLRPHLEKLADSYDITVCINPVETDVAPIVPTTVKLLPMGIYRQIRLIADSSALLVLTMLFRREKFDLVFTMTPKGGLLGMVAARMAGIPCRIHCFTGQVWAQRSGLLRWLLKFLDKILVRCATRLLADSRSQMQFLLSQNVVTPDRIEVLANGSMAGVDTNRFSRNLEARQRIRSELGIPFDACCLLYVGRLKVEKGVADLQKAFDGLFPKYPHLHLVLVGPDEDGLGPSLDAMKNVHRIHYSFSVQDYMAAADIFCLPSYREGFGTVLIEAGASGLPAIASKIYGITDAVIDGQTGLLNVPGDIGALGKNIATLIDDTPRRKTLGEAGRKRALEMFNRDFVTGEMAAFFERMLKEHAR